MSPQRVGRPHNVATPPLDISGNDLKAVAGKDIDASPMFVAILLARVKIGIQPNCPKVDDYIKKRIYSSSYSVGY